MKIKKTATTIMLCGICLSMVVAGLVFARQLESSEVSAAGKADLSGKDVLFDGDSIAMGSAAFSASSSPRWSYADYLVEEYQINKTNVSFNGARFYWPNAAANCSDDTNNCHIILKHLTSAVKNTSYDYIILEGAINDLHSNYESDTTAYAGELRRYFDVVTSNPKWTKAKIGFVIVPKPDYERRSQYTPALEGVFWKEVQDICDEYSIDYINFFKQSEDDDFVVPDGFDWEMIDVDVNDTDSAGSFDGLHPSKGAHRVMGEYIANWMVNLPNYKYMVSFDSNGSSLVDIDDQAVIHGKRVAEPNVVMGGNEVFDYWSTAANCSTEFNFNTAINQDTKLYACWHYDYVDIVENYKIVANEDYLDLTSFYDNAKGFKELFGTGYVLEVDTEAVGGNTVLYTSGKTKLYKNNNLQATYTNVIRGDTNGDGDIGIRDYIEIKKDIMDTGKLQNEYRLAGDVNKNDRVDIQDYIEVKKQIMN